MAWAYTYKAGPKGGTLQTLLDYCTFVRIPAEIASGPRGVDPVVQYRHGAHHVRKWQAPLELMLECGIRYTNSAGAVTHADGAEGHFYENRATVLKLLSGEAGGLATLQRIAPDHGTVEIDVLPVSQPMPSQQRWVIGVLLGAPDPFWRETSQQSSATTSLVVGGNAPVADATIEFTGAATNALLTHTASGAAVGIEGALPAGGVVVDVGAGTAVRISGGADYSAFLTVNRPWWLELEPDKTNPVTHAGGGTITTKWYNKWR